MKTTQMQRGRAFTLAIAVAAFGAGAQAQKTKEAWEYLKEPAFKTADTKALGAKASPLGSRSATGRRPRTSSSRSPASATR